MPFNFWSSTYMKYAAIFFVLLFSSCNYPCAPSLGLRMELVGFTEQEASVIILKKYKKSTGFTTPIDSLLIDSTVTRFKLNNDTLKITSTISSTNLLSNFDYIISLPQSNAVFYISEMNEPQIEGRKGLTKIMCGNSIQSCKINSLQTTIRSDKLYLRK